MKFTAKQKLEGEKLSRQLRDKALAYYDQTDPCAIYVTDKCIYVNDGGADKAFANLEDVNAYMTEMYNIFQYDNTGMVDEYNSYQ